MSPQTLRWSVVERDERTASVERLRLLVPAEEHDAVSASLRESDFRTVTLAHWCRTPAGSDWFGIDDTDGILLHVCLQRRLVLGSAARGWLIIDRVPGAPTPTSASPRSMSLALSLCERTLRGETGSWQERSDGTHRHAALHEAFTDLFGAESAAGLTDAVVGADATALRRRLITLTSGRSMGERVRRMRYRLSILNRNGPRLPLFARRERSVPALAIAVIGSDGSGKSTVSRWLAETLDIVFGARFLYFGTGDGPGSPVRRVLNGIKRRSRFGTTAPPAGSGDVPAPPRRTADTAPILLRLIWTAVVASERVGKMRALRRARRAGFIVVTDRYPQNEQPGIHDGPRLGDLLETGRGGPPAMLARMERSLYARLARHVPDRVLLLDVPLEVARRRRPEEPEAELARRVAVARSLHFGGAQRLVLDAAEPLATVKARALHGALDALSGAGASPHRDRDRFVAERSRV